MSDQRMKPIVILPEGEMTAENIAELRANGICVVEAKNPALVKFLDPIPSAAERTRVEDAAIELSRKILNRGFWNDDNAGGRTRADMARAYFDILARGSRLDPEITQAEKEKKVFDQAKWDELAQLAREEARAERKAAKAAKEAEKAAAAAAKKPAKS